MLGLKLNHVSKRGHWWIESWLLVKVIASLKLALVWVPTITSTSAGLLSVGPLGTNWEIWIKVWTFPFSDTVICKILAILFNANESNPLIPVQWMFQCEVSSWGHFSVKMPSYQYNCIAIPIRYAQIKYPQDIRQSNDHLVVRLSYY